MAPGLPLTHSLTHPAVCPSASCLVGSDAAAVDLWWGVILHKLLGEESESGHSTSLFIRLKFETVDYVLVACDSCCLFCGPKIIEGCFEMFIGWVLFHMFALDGGIVESW